MALSDIFAASSNTATQSSGLASIFSSAPPDRTPPVPTSIPAPQPSLLSKVGNFLYDTIGGIVLPGATPTELRTPQILKDTATGLPAAALSYGEQVAEHPIDSVVGAVGGAARGIADTVTNAIINLAPTSITGTDRDSLKNAVSDTLNKYLGATPQNSVTTGFRSAGQAAPALIAGGGLGDVFASVGGRVAGAIGEETGSLLGRAANLANAKLGATIGQLSGEATGFVGTGQTQLPLNAPVQDRVNQAMSDLVGLGLFKVGSIAFSKAKGLVTTAIKSMPPPDEGTPPSGGGATKVPVTSETPDEQPVKVNTPATKHAEYAASQGYEPYTPPDQLPVIDAGKPAKSELPTIQAEAPAKTKLGSLTVEPVKPQSPPVTPQKATTAMPAPKTTETAPTAAEAPTAAPSEAPKPLTTEPGVSRIGKSIEAKAVEAKLTKKFEGTAGYDPITIKDQADRATKLVNETPDQARAVIRGEEPLPQGLRGTALITAMEERIKATKDTSQAGELAYELANSPLVSKTSEAAQEMRLMAEREPDSITAKFQEAKAAREANLEKRGGVKKLTEKVVKEEQPRLQREIQKTASKRQTWEEFMKQITCNV